MSGGGGGGGEGGGLAGCIASPHLKALFENSCLSYKSFKKIIKIARLKILAKTPKYFLNWKKN